MRFKRLFILATVGIAMTLSLIFSCNHIVVRYAKGRVFDNCDAVPEREVALLLGTTPQSRIAHMTNYFFIYRIDAAENLYKNGKVSRN